MRTRIVGRMGGVVLVADAAVIRALVRSNGEAVTLRFRLSHLAPKAHDGVMQAGGTRYAEYAVHEALAPFVKCIWSMESDRPIYDGPRERILPDSCVELVFHFKDPFRSHFADGGTALQPRSFVVGQMRRFLEIEPAGGMGLIAVRFHAHGAYRFFAQSLREIADGVVDLRNIWTKGGDECSERVAFARSPRDRLHVLEDALLKSLRANDRNDCTVDRCLQRINSTRGQVNIAELARDLGISNRQLARRFENAVGFSPKEFARVIRFLHAVRSLSQRTQHTLTETALECGYFDQAHFNHEFREFAGMTPGQFPTFPHVAF